MHIRPAAVSVRFPWKAEYRALLRQHTSNRPACRDLAEAYGRFLDRWPWSWFTTHTFREETHPEAAGKTWNRWVHWLNRDIFGCRYWRRPQDGVIWARGLEYQRRGVIHFHALIGRVPETIRRLDWMDRWNALAGFARIEAYDPAKGARYYLGKYVLKGGHVDLGGPLRPPSRCLSFGQVVTTPEPKRGVPEQVRRVCPERARIGNGPVPAPGAPS